MQKKDLNLQIIGGGKMGQALLAGLLNSQWASPEHITVIEPLAEICKQIEQDFHIKTLDQPLEKTDTIIAVKPHIVDQVCRSLPNPTRVLSIAAGITTTSIEKTITTPIPVIRAMPNTAALVGAGTSALAGGINTSTNDMTWAKTIMEAVGVAVVVPEAMLDAVTGLSGSGPAYIFLLTEALIDAGVAAGIPRQTAATLATNTIYGAGKLMVETNLNPLELRAQVTTPAGTTAAGLAELETAGIRSAAHKAVQAATARSRELGEQ